MFASSSPNRHRRHETTFNGPRTRENRAVPYRSSGERLYPPPRATPSPLQTGMARRRLRTANNPTAPNNPAPAVGSKIDAGDVEVEDVEVPASVVEVAELPPWEGAVVDFAASPPAADTVVVVADPAGGGRV